MRYISYKVGWCAVAVMLIAMTGRSETTNAHTPSESTTQPGDEIIVCGERFHTAAPVVLWTDQGGYDFHYSKAPGAPDERKPSHVRMSPLTDPQVAQVRRDGWTLDFLRDNVDQFVIHYSVDGTSRLTFETLVKRHLSVQLMLDLDGTIYQAMDLQEEAPHATRANGRSVGIEIANIGAYSGGDAPLKQWYKKDANGKIFIKIPAELGDGGIRTKDFVARPARPEIIKGVVQGKVYEQYDLTPQQYDSLIKLTATLCTVLPNIKCDYPKDSNRKLITHTLTPEQWQAYQGVLGHYHVQDNKQDPGPAFQWDRVINGARKLMNQNPLPPGDPYEQQPALAKK